jgi:hypothetical protein
VRVAGLGLKNLGVLMYVKRLITVLGLARVLLGGMGK